MNIIIDEGNSFVKIAVFDNGKLQKHQRVLFGEVSEGVENLQRQFPISKGIVSSVVAGVHQRFAFLERSLSELHYLNATTPVPFNNAYASPSSLGVDRIALAAAAVTRYSGQDVLVIDAGTCITFDMVERTGVFRGGAIAPGIQMRFRAMHEFTSKLPLVESQDFDMNNYIGDTTEKCMLSGVYHNIVCEIEGVIARYSEQYRNLTVVLTGGDHLYLAKTIKSRIFANPFFLLEGLDAILVFQRGKEEKFSIRYE
ncbi:MAG: type III pantothenate kinase [Capnocytophaga sp.]|nr:type III pantothenate kinase [Capnocytophaga sp.]